MDTGLFQKILNISLPENDQDLHYYCLLDIKLFEADGREIHKAGLKQIKKLKEWQLHPDKDIQDEVQNMLNEVSMACSVLEVSGKKSEYDRQLAEQLNINLEQDPAYTSALNVTVELKKCPSCGVDVSQLAILCIDCGYHFEKKLQIQTELGSASVPKPWEEQIAQAPKVSGPSPVKKTLSCLYNMIKLFLVLVILAAAIFSIIISLPPKAKYRVDFNSSLKERYCKLLDKSPLWQLYFKYRERKESPPFVEFKITKKKEFIQEKRTVFSFYTKIFTIPDKQEIYNGRMRIKEFVEFNDKSDKFLNDLIKTYLTDMAKKNGHFEAFVKNAISKEGDPKIRAEYSEILP